MLRDKKIFTTIIDSNAMSGIRRILLVFAFYQGKNIKTFNLVFVLAIPLVASVMGIHELNRNENNISATT